MISAIRTFLSGTLLYSAYFFFKLLPLDTASALGGWIGRTVGPRLRWTITAEHNLTLAMPQLSKEQRQKIINGMWDNLGRVMAEFPHMETFNRQARTRLTFVGQEHILAAVKKNQSCIFVSGHFANWELTPLAVLDTGQKMAAVFRPPNNPAARYILSQTRQYVSNYQIPKGQSGLRDMARMLKNGAHTGLILLVDQKMNTGTPIPFFERPAMTATAAAALAYKFNCALIPIRTERISGAHFRITLLPPLSLLETGDRKKDIYSVMENIHQILEKWIRERPEQWLWIHRRWPESKREKDS